MSRLDDTLEILAELVAFPTVSLGPNRALIDRVADRLDACGARVEIVAEASGTRANLFATLGPDAGGGIVLSGHTDVVPADEEGWLSDPFAMSVRDGRAFGRGTCDMKGFVATAVAMAPFFAALPLVRPLHFAFTYDEEVGCLGARRLVEVLAEREARPAVAIVGEPTEMRMVDAHKGCFEYTTRFVGLTGHGSAPARGVSAIEAAVRYSHRLLALRPELSRRAPADSPFEPPCTTLQVGRISGGTARNVIAGHCEVEWELRPVQPSDADFVLAEVAAFEDALRAEMTGVHAGCDVTREVVGEVVGLEPRAANEARDLVARLTGANGTETAAFGTEAGLFQSVGMSAVVCGPGAIAQAHKPNEYVALAELQKALHLMDRLQTVVARG